MSKFITEKPYFLLAEPVALDDDDDTLNRLLGLAVANPYKPTGVAYSPDKPLRPRDAIDNLYPSKPVVCTDFQLVQSKTSTDKATAKLERLVKFSLEHGGSRKADFSAAGFRRFTMDNAKRRLEALLREPAKDAPGSEATHSADQSEQLNNRAKYRKEVLEFLHEQKNGKLAIITGFITCTDLSKNLDRSKKTAGKFEAGTGPNGTFEAELAAEHSRTNDFGVQGAYVGEYLIACSYFPLYAVKKPEKSSGTSFFGFLSSSSSKPKNDGNFSVGTEEMWRIGDKEIEGNTEPLLGKAQSAKVTVEAGQEDMAVELLYAPSDDESDDESPEHGAEDEDEDDEENREETGRW
ncbi:hypothetical protein ACHAPT_011934 [Fusarium lateritium]